MDGPAFPIQASQDLEGKFRLMCAGLSKREWIATFLFQGYTANTAYKHADMKDSVKKAIAAADELIARLHEPT